MTSLVYLLKVLKVFFLFFKLIHVYYAHLVRSARVYAWQLISFIKVHQLLFPKAFDALFPFSLHVYAKKKYIHLYMSLYTIVYCYAYFSYNGSQRQAQRIDGTEITYCEVLIFLGCIFTAGKQHAQLSKRNYVAWRWPHLAFFTVY